jgi:hypothetical protein
MPDEPRVLPHASYRTARVSKRFRKAFFRNLPVASGMIETRNWRHEEVAS